MAWTPRRPHTGEVPEPSPFLTSLCHRCVHKRDVKTDRSWFFRCAKLEAKYPPQPVRECEAFEAQRTRTAKQ